MSLGREVARSLSLSHCNLHLSGPMQDEVHEPLSDHFLTKAIEGNAVDGCLDWASWDELELHQSQELTWTITSVPFPLFNNILRAQLTDPEQTGDERTDELIRAAMAPFVQKNVPFAWWLGPSTGPTDLGNRLEALGMTHGATMTGMAADLETVEGAASMPKGLDIQEVTDAADLETWCGVLGEVYNFPDLALGPWRRLHEAMGLGPGGKWRHFLGRLDGRAAATSSLFLGRLATSVASIATVRDVRGKGVGTAMSLYPLLLARQEGYRVATLCSSQAAVSVYRRLGFRKYCELDLFLAPAPAPEP